VQSKVSSKKGLTVGDQVKHRTEAAGTSGTITAIDESVATVNWGPLGYDLPKRVPATQLIPLGEADTDVEDYEWKDRNSLTVDWNGFRIDVTVFWPERMTRTGPEEMVGEMDDAQFDVADIEIYDAEAAKQYLADVDYEDPQEMIMDTDLRSEFISDLKGTYGLTAGLDYV